MTNYKKLFQIRTYFPKGLWGRMLLIIILPIFLAQILSGIIFYNRYYTNVANQSAILFVGNVLTINDLMSRVKTEEDFNEVASLAKKNYMITMKFERDGTLEHKRVSKRIKFLSTQYITRILNQNLGRKYSLNADEGSRKLEVQVQYDSGVLVLSSGLNTVFQRTFYIFIYWLFGSFLIFALIAISFARSQIKSIKELTDAIRRAGRGEDISDFVPSGALQIAKAGAVFGKTTKRERNFIESQKTMLAGVSHDLKTPLTRMKLEAEFMGVNGEPVAAEVDDMTKIIDAYLTSIKENKKEDSEEVNIFNLAENVLRKLSRGAYDVAISGSRDAFITVRPNAMERAITNIISNALRYGNGVVRVSVKDTKEAVILEVEDNGSGIPLDRREDMFKPFTKLDESRNNAGIGLGLSIVQEIIYKHGGDVALLDSTALGGLRVRVELPKD